MELSIAAARDNDAAAVDGLVALEGGPLDAGGEEGRLALIVGNRGGLTLGAKQVERNALLADERQKFIRRMGPDPVGEFAFPGLDLPGAQFPRHMDCGPAGRRENVRGRIEDQVVSFTERFDVVLYHQAAADRLDVDGHPLAVRRGREAGSDVRWRTALIFRLGQIEAPGWNIDLLDRCVDDGGEAG